VFKERTGTKAQFDQLVEEQLADGFTSPQSIAVVSDRLYSGVFLIDALASARG